MLKECSEVDVCMYISEGGREVSEQIVINDKHERIGNWRERKKAQKAFRNWNCDWTKL